MGSRALLAARTLTVAAVAALLVLLVWKVVHDERSQLPATLGGKNLDAPAFSLPRLDTEGELSLAGLRGKAVIVNFWASWCDPCKEEAPVLEAAWRKYRDRGLVVVGIDYDDFKGDARAFAKRYGLTYPLVYDRDKKTVARYRLAGVPETFVVDRRGRLVAERISGAVEPDELEQAIERALDT